MRIAIRLGASGSVFEAAVADRDIIGPALDVDGKARRSGPVVAERTLLDPVAMPAAELLVLVAEVHARLTVPLDGTSGDEVVGVTMADADAVEAGCPPEIQSSTRPSETLQQKNTPCSLPRARQRSKTGRWEPLPGWNPRSALLSAWHSTNSISSQAWKLKPSPL